MQFSVTKSLSIVLLACGLAAQTVHAETYDNPLDFLKKSTLNGNVRVYDFFRNYSSSTAPPNQRAFSAGGMLNFLTAPVLGGLRGGATYYLADSLGLNSSNPHAVDNTLPGFNVNVLGQLFLEYEMQQFLVRAGDQLVKTPWVGDSDSRMIPSTYQGFFGEVTPYKDLNFIGMWMDRFKSRTASNFSETNLYNSRHVGGEGFPQLSNLTSDGVVAVGANYNAHGWQPELWYYQFYDYAKLFYGNVIYTWDTGKPIKPLVGVQAARESGDGSNYLQLIPKVGGVVDSNLWGVMGGFNIYDGRITLGYNDVPTHKGAFNNGDLASPYTAGYATDPLYTTSMIAGLIEKAAGHAVKLTGGYNFFKNSLKLAASYAVYETKPSPIFASTNTKETDFDVTYNFNGRLKGLSARNRLGVEYGIPALGHFVYDRIMLQYNF